MTMSNAQPQQTQQTQEKVEQFGQQAKQGAAESAQKLASQTGDAAQAFKQEENPIKGIESFVEKMPANYYLFGSLGSIALSALLMLSGKQRAAIFVGLWPATIINFALMAKRLRPSQEM